MEIRFPPPQAIITKLKCAIFSCFILFFDLQSILISLGLVDNDSVDADDDWGVQSDWLTPQVPSRTKETVEASDVPQTEPARKEKKKTKKNKKKTNTQST